jgi:hypothetical protein
MQFVVMRPKYKKTGEKFTGPDGKPLEWCEVKDWTIHGVIEATGPESAMVIANTKYPRGREYGHSHILERVTTQ